MRLRSFAKGEAFTNDVARRAGRQRFVAGDFPATKGLNFVAALERARASTAVAELRCERFAAAHLRPKSVDAVTVARLWRLARR